MRKQQHDEAAIDDTLAYIAKSDERIAAMEAEARKMRNS